MKDYFYDLHLHSCLSPCGGDDTTPADLAGMCALAGYQIVALTDHNTVGNCAAFCKAAEHYGLLALPGMELTTAEEVHVVCLFPDLDSAHAFGEYVRAHLPAVPNRPDFFGAASPNTARALYEEFIALLQAQLSHVAHGEFGADMQVSLCNDGPVTIVMESDVLKKKK